MNPTEPRYWIADLEAIEPQPCPCGLSRRAFVRDDNQTATLHVVDIKEDSETHYHKKLTEIYYFLEGEGYMELDGERIPVKPHTSIFIKPGCRHRAVGNLKTIVIPMPGHDPEDEWFD